MPTFVLVSIFALILRVGLLKVLVNNLNDSLSLHTMVAKAIFHRWILNIGRLVPVKSTERYDAIWVFSRFDQLTRKSQLKRRYSQSKACAHFSSRWILQF